MPESLAVRTATETSSIIRVREVLDDFALRDRDRRGILTAVRHFPHARAAAVGAIPCLGSCGFARPRRYKALQVTSKGSTATRPPLRKRLT